jgi:hypothetical protein
VKCTVVYCTPKRSRLECKRKSHQRELVALQIVLFSHSPRELRGFCARSLPPRHRMSRGWTVPNLSSVVGAGVILAIIPIASTSAQTATRVSIANSAVYPISVFHRASSPKPRPFCPHEVPPGGTFQIDFQDGGLYDLVVRHNLPSGEIVDFGVSHMNFSAAVRESTARQVGLVLPETGRWKALKTTSHGRWRPGTKYVKIRSRCKGASGGMDYTDTLGQVAGFSVPSLEGGCYPAYPIKRKIPPPPIP